MTTSAPEAPAPPRAQNTLPPTWPVAMILAPVLLLASTVAFLTVGGGINDGILGGVLTVWAVLAFALAFLGCARLLEPGMPRAARVLTFGAAALAVGGAGFGISAVHVEVLREDHGVDAVAALDAHPLTWLALLPWGWFMPLTCILAGVFLWRGRLVPWWHGILFILGGVLFVTGRPAQIGLVAVGTDLVLLAAFGILAVRLLLGRRARGKVSR